VPSFSGPNWRQRSHPHELFVRLKLFGAETRRSHQDILLTALEEYLQRNAAKHR
jgi:hypothetical protein